MFFKNESWVELRKESGDSCSGKTSASGKKRGVRFWLSLSDGDYFLRMEGEDYMIIDHLSKKIGKPDIKWVVSGWFRTHTMYAWIRDPQELKELSGSLSCAIAMRGTFSLSGIESFERLAA